MKERLQSLLLKIIKKNRLIRLAMHEEFKYSLLSTSLISSRGFLHSCDLHISKPKSGDVALPNLDPLFQLDSKNSISIYISTPAIPHFLQVIDRKKTRPFILVTGDSTKSAGADDQIEAALAIASHPGLIRWFAQNLAITHPKVECLPLGLDYHSAWKDPEIFGNRYLMPIHQERELLSIAAQAIPISLRKNDIYCDWHFVADRGDRKIVLETIDPALAFFTETRMTRENAWRHQSHYAFVASPLGAGWDCHRTWEAIFLGCIPIVSHSPVASLFEGLPVITVKNWNTLSVDFLREQLEVMIQKKYDFSSLFLQYWQNRFKCQNPPKMSHLTISQFQYFLRDYLLVIPSEC